MMNDPKDLFRVTRTKIFVVGSIITLVLCLAVILFAPKRNLEGVTTRALTSSQVSNPQVGATVEAPAIPTASALDNVAVEALFVKFCAMCHGEDGNGNAQMSRMSKVPITNLVSGPFKRERTPVAVQEIIMKGLGGMPGFGKELGELNANRLANYALSLEKK